MRFPNQVSVYCLFCETGRNFYILAKRNKKRGGFWQPITGGEEDIDKGDLFQTVIRETKEELGIEITKKQIWKIPYSFQFIDKDGVQRTEYCFGVVLTSKQKEKIRLSKEHTAIIYGTDVEYLKSLLKFEENRIALDKFYQWAKTNLKD
ncbi:NUDIX domain-containing protein [bacterium]|nr:NUDIX domain-containing protein [bacterium]